MQNITGHFYAISDFNSAFTVIQLPSGVFENGEFTLPKSSINDIINTNQPMRKILFNAANVARTATETRGSNTAFHPRIHV